MNANKLLCRLLLLFPVFTLFQSFPLLRWINKALLICVIIVLLFLTVRKMKKRWAGILVTVVVVHVYALMQTTFPLYNSNMLFYYGLSITGDSFRLAPTCLMIVTLVLGLYCLTKSKKYLFYTIIPMYGFLMCGSRTYLGIGLLVVLAFWYIYCEKKRYFYFLLIH